MNRYYLILASVIVLWAQAAAAAQSEERLKLDKTTILGNGELPKVTFVVPWREVPSAVPESQPSRAQRPHPPALDSELNQRRIEYLQQIKRRAKDTAAP